MEIHLLKDTETLSKYTKVNASFPESSWRAYLPDALFNHILPLTGENLIQIANEYAATDNQDDETKTKLKEQIERCAACFVMQIYAPEGSLAVSDSGHTVIRTDHTAPASDYKIKKYRESLIARGFQAIEMLHRFLITEIENPLFSAWIDSIQFQNMNNYLNTAFDFENFGCVKIYNSRMFLEETRSLMTLIEEKHITPMLTPETRQKLIRVAKGFKDQLNANETVLLSIIRKFVALRTAQIITESKDSDTSLFLRALHENSHDVNSYYKNQALIYFSQINNFLLQHSELGKGIKNKSINTKNSSFFFATY